MGSSDLTNRESSLADGGETDNRLEQRYRCAIESQRADRHRSTWIVATPKGMRAQQFPVNASDAIHLYSDDNHIWLQIRRNVPTEQDIGRSSFKAALCLQPGTAEKLGLELMNIAARNKEKLKAKAVAGTKATKAKTTGS
jgi:hypothetical protein